jgi:hypothetical protein
MCIYICVCVCVYICIHIYTPVSLQTNTYTHIPRYLLLKGPDDGDHKVSCVEHCDKFWCAAFLIDWLIDWLAD